MSSDDTSNAFTAESVPKLQLSRFGSFSQSTVGEMPSFVTLLTFKVSGETLEVCAVSCITTSHADGQV